MRYISRSIITAAAITLAVSSAQAGVIFNNVHSKRALYFEDWGHPFTETWDGETRESNEASGINRGVPARAVRDFNGPFNYGGTSLLLFLGRGMAGANSTLAFGPDGVGGPLWRDLRLYSLIGIWSSDPFSIDPLGDPFFLGSQSVVSVPSSPDAYLFLAFNDGFYPDNFDHPVVGNGGFQALVIGPRVNQPMPSSLLSASEVDALFQQFAVPEPASISLLAAGLVALTRRRRR